MNAELAAIIRLSRDDAQPLHRQLYDGIRAGVLDGRLPRGTRLPATRDLAVQFGLSRNTVTVAFGQLMAEGYLEGRVGDGTYVTESLPDDLLRAEAPVRPSGRATASAPPNLSRRGHALVATPVTAPRRATDARAFRVGMADYRLFPFEAWSRIVARHWRTPDEALLGYGDPAGIAPLREAIARHAAASRGVRCDASQVVVVSGSQQALDLSARLLLDPGDRAWIEEPGYLGARAALLAAGADLEPVPVDAQGIDVAAGLAAATCARLAYVTPSHQYPLGATMSLQRRLALLEWASRERSWILEDDYDSEYRYAGRPLAALQGLDRDGRVIYIGTFSKVMFPALRIAYVIAPPGMAEAFARARALTDRHPPAIEQVALAEFIADGHLGRHIRRTRGEYAARRVLVLALAPRLLPGGVNVEAADAGMHGIAWLPPGVDGSAASAAAARRGVDATPVSAYRLGSAERDGLMLGYAAADATEIAAGLQALGEALRPLVRRAEKGAAAS